MFPEALLAVRAGGRLEERVLQTTGLEGGAFPRPDRLDEEGPEHRIHGLVEPIARAAGCEVLDVELIGAGSQRTLRITLDKPEGSPAGVTLDDCAEVSRRLNPVLDVEDPVAGSYQLEVSSPGLNRPLKRERDFERHRGQRAKIETRRPIEPDSKQKKFSGVLGELKDGRIALALDDGGRVVEIPLEQVRKANLIYEFENL